MRLLFALLLLPFCGFSQRNPYDPGYRFAPDRLRQDFAVLQTALEQLHPGLYHYTSRDSMARAYRETLARLNEPMTDAQFGLVIRPYLGLLRCVHTRLDASRDRVRYVRSQKFAPFPLSLIRDGEKLYVVASADKYASVRAFDELVAVNGQPVTKLLNQFDPQNWADGYATTARMSLSALRFGLWYQTTYGYSDSLTVQLADSTGRQRTETLAFNRKSIRRLAKNAQADSTRQQVTALKAIPLFRKKDLSLTLVGGDSTLAVLRIDGFKGSAMRRQFRRAFTLLHQHHVRQLAIDLRGNFGGSAITCRDLLRYVADRPFQFWDSTIVKRRSVRAVPTRVHYGGLLPWLELKLRVRRDSSGSLQLATYRHRIRPYAKSRFSGPVYVLINSLSFSAAAIFPALAKSLNARVTLVGRETGGGAVSCNAGQSFRVVLPNTKYVAVIPYYHIRWNQTQPDRGRGVQPDVPVQTGLTNWRRGVDADLEQVKALVNKP